MRRLNTPRVITVLVLVFMACTTVTVLTDKWVGLLACVAIGIIAGRCTEDWVRESAPEKPDNDRTWRVD